MASSAFEPLNTAMAIMSGTSSAPATGYVGVYSRILRLAEKASADYGIETGIILADVGQRSMVGEQENMIAGIAFELLGE